MSGLEEEGVGVEDVDAEAGPACCYAGEDEDGVVGDGGEW